MTRLRHEGAPGGQDRWTLDLMDIEASIIASLPDQVEALLDHPESNRRVIERLFPPSYDDPEEEATNRRLLGASLLEERQEMLAAVRKQLSQGKRQKGNLQLTLDRVAMDLWLRFINDVRLVIATDLGLGSARQGEPKRPPADHPDAPKHALLDYLGGVEAILVEALTRRQP